MKAFFACFAFAAIIQLSTMNLAGAQSAKPATLQVPAQHIAVDGSIKEWGDSLSYFNTEKHINYALANNRDTLYMAVRIADRSEQTRILKAGLTLSINTKGKKKESYSITFPLNTNGSPAPVLHREDNDEPIQQNHEELMQAVLTVLRGIKVTGFKDIEGEMITTSNTYGIHAAIDYDDKGDLICEASIPLVLFHAGDASKSEWAFNFKINGITRPAMPQGEGEGGGRGGRGGGGREGGGGRGGSRGGNRGGAGISGDAGRGELFKSEDFWEKFYLAK